MRGAGDHEEHGKEMKMGYMGRRDGSHHLGGCSGPAGKIKWTYLCFLGSSDAHAGAGCAWRLGEWRMGTETSGERLLLSGAQWPQQAEPKHLGSSS